MGLRKKENMSKNTTNEVKEKENMSKNTTKSYI